MKLTLALPSLNRHTDETLPPLALESFNQILRYGKLHKQAQRPSEFYACHLWQGSLALHAKRILNIQPQQATVFASPMWQQMGLHQANVISGSNLNIQIDEAERLCHELSDFYREDNWQFHLLRPDLWLITLPSEPNWQVAPALDIGGQISAADHPLGNDAVQWLEKQTEIQMWLHQHPINVARCNTKRAEINGLWLWQDIQGRATAPLLATDTLWAQFSQASKIHAPYHFADYLTLTTQQGSHFSDGLIFLDDLVVTEQTGDVYAYQEILQSWEIRWFAPLWQALNTGRLKQLMITTDGEHGGKLVITPKSKWAFWKGEKRFDGIW